MGEIEVVEYDQPFEAAHVAFARRNWPTKARRSDASYVRWKFRGHADGPVRGLLLAISHGEVVGQAGLLPGTVMLDGAPQPAQWICDLMVDPAHRRKGILTALLAEGLNRPEISLGPDPSPSARKALDAFGMSQFEASTLMVLTIRAGPTLTVRYPRLRRLEPLLTFAGAPALAAVNRKLASGGSTTAGQICSWRDVVQPVHDFEHQLSQPHAVHDLEFLQWRCGGFGGWVRELEAVRTERGSFAIVERDEHRLVVHEWSLCDHSEGASLFGRVLYLAKAYGVDYIQAYSSTSAELQPLTELGFRPRRAKIDMWVFPAERISAADGFAFMGYDSDYQL